MTNNTLNPWSQRAKRSAMKWLRRTAGLAVVVGSLGAISKPAISDTITFWTPEEQPERLAIQRQLADQFKQITGHTVSVVPVSEKDLGTRMTAAFAAGNMPDVVYHTLQYVQPWARAGILDTEAATEVVQALGSRTFVEQPLRIALFEGSEYASVPVDSWTQMIVYRKDLFEKNGLAPPDSFENILAAIKALHNPPDLYGFVAATKVDETYMMQVLEHLFLAGGYSPVDGASDAALRQTLELYREVVKASPPGELYWKQSRELYFAGRAAMIVWSPFILDELAGLRDSAPPTINRDTTSRELAQRTGFITEVKSPSNPSGAAWADIRYMGITSDANIDVAVAFVQYAMSEGYGYILRIAPEGKFPARRGDGSNPERYVDEWASLDVGVDRKAPLADLYPPDVVQNIIAGLGTGDRWGLRNNELERASRITSSLLYNRIVRRYTDDEIDLDEAVRLIREEVEKIR